MPQSIDEIAHELAASRARLDAMAAGSRLVGTLARFVGRLERRLSRPPRIVLLGEFNTGKSTLANALIGREVLPTSIHANTRLPLLVHYSQAPTLLLESRDRQRLMLDAYNIGVLGSLGASHGCLLHVGLPVADLERFELIDTPGLASGIAYADEMMLDACHRAHIAIWCTSAAQAWKASEQAVWRSLPRRLLRNGILAVTNVDLLASERDRDRLDARLQAESSDCFHGRVMISTGDADELRRGPRGEDYAARWKACGGAALEAMIDALVAREREGRRASAGRVIERAAARLVPGDPPTGAEAA
jgi:hypothetical protein